MIKNIIITMIISNTLIAHATAGECTRVARDCIEPGETRMIDGRSIYRDCWKYKDAYKCEGYAENNCTVFDDESSCELENSTCKKYVGTWCVAWKRDYKCETEETYTKKEKRYRAPTFEKKNAEERKRVVCGEKIRCIDGKCFDMTHPANDEIGAAAGMLATLKNMQGQWQKNLGIFKGSHETCAKKITSYTSCCAKVGAEEGQNWGKIFGAKCNEKEKSLAKKRGEERCVEIGTYCSTKVLGICVIKKT